MRSLGCLAVAVAATVTMSACGGSGPSTPASTSGAGKTLNVWYMAGDLSAESVSDINAKFEKETGAKVNVEMQQWDNINTKLSTALSQDDAPDIVEIGNTDVPLFAATGALLDLTGHKDDLARGETWLPGLAGPATVDSKTYAAPMFAGAHAVVYDKAMWAKAGVTAPPASFSELVGDLDKIKAAHPGTDFSALHFPGKYWYAAMQFVWDAGGDLATSDGGKEKGALSSPNAQKGLEEWKQFQNAYSSTASRTGEAGSPDQDPIFASGKASAVITTVNHLATIEKDNPALKDRLGSFVFPSQHKPGSTQPVFLGGSDVAIPAKSKNQDLALSYLKLLTSDDVQLNDMFKMNGWAPISSQLLDKALSSVPEIQKPFFEAAKNSASTPAVPGWATIESDGSMKTFFADIATGDKTVSDAAKSMDAHLDQALNASN